MKIIIRSGIYRTSPSKEIELSDLRWLTQKQSFEFTMGGYDGFYETSLSPSVKVEKLSFSDGVAEIFISSEKEIETLANELLTMNEKCCRSRSNVRM